MKEVETGDGVPENLQGKGAIIFGNIDKLKDFHKNEMYPALLKCNEDPESICKVFTSLVSLIILYSIKLIARIIFISHSNFSANFTKNF